LPDFHTSADPILNSTLGVSSHSDDQRIDP